MKISVVFVYLFKKLISYKNQWPTQGGDTPETGKRKGKKGKGKRKKKEKERRKKERKKDKKEKR